MNFSASHRFQAHEFSLLASWNGFSAVNFSIFCSFFFSGGFAVFFASPGSKNTPGRWTMDGQLSEQLGFGVHKKSRAYLCHIGNFGGLWGRQVQLYGCISQESITCNTGPHKLQRGYNTFQLAPGLRFYVECQSNKVQYLGYKHVVHYIKPEEKLWPLHPCLCHVHFLPISDISICFDGMCRATSPDSQNPPKIERQLLELWFHPPFACSKRHDSKTDRGVFVSGATKWPMLDQLDTNQHCWRPRKKSPIHKVYETHWMECQ